MENDFALLTLSDHEQRELYEAARVIQTAFRKYKGRRLKEQQEVAAAVIQRCYRKYKQVRAFSPKYTDTHLPNLSLCYESPNFPSLSTS